MKKMYKIKILIISLSTFVLGIVLTRLIVGYGIFGDILIFTESGIAITSFIVSFVALIFAMVTFFCIDSVNNITAMEGNVLENESYSIAYEEVIDQFENEKNQEDFTDKLFSIIEPPRKSETCMHFADSLQNIIDYIIWFAYIDLNNEHIKKRCNDLIEIIDNERNRFGKLSNGINYLLNENVKLIKYVLDYQQIRCSEKDYVVSKLENIRGEMLKNPVSRIVYFDYLGLHYRKKAAQILNACGDSNAEFSVEHMSTIKTFHYTDEELKHFECMIERAEKCFMSAQEIAKNNILWNGYISYNMLRVSILKNLIGRGVTDGEIFKEIDNVIRIRENAEYLFSRKDSYLDKVFAKETMYAKELKKNYCKLNRISQI